MLIPVFTIGFLYLQYAFAAKSGGFLSSNIGNNPPLNSISNALDPRFITKDHVKERYQSTSPSSISSRNRIAGESYSSVSPDDSNANNWLKYFPRINFIIDPIINFKIKQRISFFGACATLGMDYLTDISQWRLHMHIEDSIVGGRFSLRGSELGWAKAWYMNLDALQVLGLGIDNKAKVKVRLGLNLNNYQAYFRVRFRSEPVNSFNIADGLTLFGKVNADEVTFYCCSN